MSVDLSKIKVGDEVTVRMVVTVGRKNDFRGLHYVLCESPYGDRAAAPVPVLDDRIVSHTPASKALAVGDRVKPARWREPNTSQDSGVIRAIDGGVAWVKWGRPLLYNPEMALSELERVND